MPLIKDGCIVEDDWTHVPDGEAVPADRPAIISFERFQAERATFEGRNAALGVRVKSGTLAPAIAADLERFALIAIEFPKFRDGRGFSTARELRERYGYEGEIRAVGHFIPDQYQFAVRTGFTSAEAPANANPESWARALTEITVAFQPSLDDPQPLSLLRRRLGA
ncbi:DUF934 domain-containing protein [Azospirillum canadense]|uniref:DUF934 domain-containing protein n=1 Tax=Azospirillum canadense TaxID=403962 RepID=UPI002225F168|nr:DUF934 domain-containing protein [Azospirillum canadense]MCW2236618.1 uncharacterized protein (DUF934 family) [Azospirillum canadense]